MKFPHLKLLFFMALLALTSCDKENLELSNDQLSLDSSIGMRCCDGSSSQMLEDPRFLDFYNEFTNGLFNPVFNILDQFDNDELEQEIELWSECLNAGNDIDECLEGSVLISQLFTIINGFDMDLLLILLDGYEYLDEEEFTSNLFDAVDQISDNTDHRLNCFHQFRDDMLEVAIATGIASLESGPGGLVVLALGYIRARMRYCGCLQTSYGASC